MFRGDWCCLLPGQKTRLARRVFLERGSSDWTCIRDRCRSGQWLWKRRRVYASDGSTVSMPDTRENQRAYPQPDTQKPGLGFPQHESRPSFLLSAVRFLIWESAPLRRQGTKRVGDARTLWNMFLPGDIFLADRLMCAWTEMVMLKQPRRRQACAASRHTAKRIFAVESDWAKGTAHIVTWLKPTKPRSIDRETYKARFPSP